MAISKQITIEQGTTFKFGVQFLNRYTNFPIDISGRTIKSQLKKTHTARTSIDIAVQILDAPTGKVILSLLPQDTSALKPGRYVYDVLSISESDATDVEKLLEGSAIVTPTATIPAA
jgi:hypothetical protein